MDIRDVITLQTMGNNAYKALWASGIAMAAHPATRKLGFRTLSYAGRLTANMAISTVKSAAGTTFVRGGTATLGSISGGIVAGYVIGAAAGTAIAYQMDGDRGMNNALNLYSGQVSAGEYFDTVSSAIKKSI